MADPIGNISKSEELFMAGVAAERTEDAANAAEARAVASEEALFDDSKDNYNVNAQQKKLTPAKDTEKLEKKARAQESVLVRKEAEDLANNFNKRKENEIFGLPTSLLAELAMTLGDRIRDDTPPAALIRVVEDILTIEGKKPDPGQIDKALEFILDIARGRLASIMSSESPSPTVIDHLSKLCEAISNAKEIYLNAHLNAITSDRRLAGLIGAVAEGGVVGTEEARKHVVALAEGAVNNPQDLTAKYNYYQSKGYKFREIKQEIDTVLKYIGQQVKTRDEIPDPKMHVLMQEARRDQAILQIFRHFKKSENLLERLLEMHGYNL